MSCQPSVSSCQGSTPQSPSPDTSGPCHSRPANTVIQISKTNTKHSAYTLWNLSSVKSIIKEGKKVSSYIAQYPVLRTAQSTLYFTSLADLFNQTPSQLFWEASSHMLQLMRKGCSYTYPPLSIARYSFIQLSELEQCRVKKLAQGFNTAAQDSNPGSRSRVQSSTP